ncbi:chloramphenicol acetyltransferase [Clostridium sardiniense]|uniref:chloramphenicol acetyltransferase n=1 Tax=Clostridium sardiniense TaxID=29369 RepID=UPI00195A786F|nr:chloramphenicol acetyltransferase [Clostridium sardiniense]MBM7834922.1 chloramphenicol O-acetyltransferase type A [Clostridium sardiniense]
MNLNIIDIEKWERRKCFEHYFNNAKCTYSITVNIEITNLYRYIKNNNLKLYPAFTWITTKCLNNHKEFKMAINDEGKLGYYDKISPCYSVLNDKTKIMDELFTLYSSDFKKFYSNMLYDIEMYKKDPTYSSDFQKNFYLVSCIPWINYSSFNVNNETNIPMLFPMVTWGKYYNENEKVFMPVSLQVHHSVADGYHCSLFYDEVQDIVSNPELYLN